MLDVSTNVHCMAALLLATTGSTAKPLYHMIEVRSRRRQGTFALPSCIQERPNNATKDARLARLHPRLLSLPVWEWLKFTVRMAYVSSFIRAALGTLNDQ